MMEWSPLYGQLFRREWVVVFSVAWAIAWLWLHELIPAEEVLAPACDPHRSPRSPKLLRKGSTASVERSAPLCARGWKKLCRAGIFSLASIACGISLLAWDISRADNYKAVLMSYSLVHQVIFAAAMGHWVLKLCEECLSWNSLTLGLENSGQLRSSLPHHVCLSGFSNAAISLLDGTCCTARHTLLLLLLFHHLGLVGIYAFILATNRLGGLGDLGLILEVVALFKLRRDLSSGYPEHPRWLQSKGAVRQHWRLTFVACGLIYLPVEIVWVVSWISDLASGQGLSTGLDKGTWAVYIVIGVFFTLGLFCDLGLLTAWWTLDEELAESYQKRDAALLKRQKTMEMRSKRRRGASSFSDDSDELGHASRGESEVSDDHRSSRSLGSDTLQLATRSYTFVSSRTGFF